MNLADVVAVAASVRKVLGGILNHQTTTGGVTTQEKRHCFIVLSFDVFEYRIHIVIDLLRTWGISTWSAARLPFLASQIWRIYFDVVFSGKILGQDLISITGMSSPSMIKDQVRSCWCRRLIPAYSKRYSIRCWDINWFNGRCCFSS